MRSDNRMHAKSKFANVSVSRNLRADLPFQQVAWNQQTQPVKEVSLGTENRFYGKVMAQFPSAYFRAQFREKRVERHRRQLLVHCCRMLGSLPDAADAVQESLLRAWRYRDSVKEGAPMCPWLWHVARNACLESTFVVWFPASSETFQ